MTSLRFGRRSLTLMLATGIAVGACAKNNNAQLADLQVELRAEREFLRETRAELEAMMTRLEPLLAMVEQVKDGSLGHALDEPRQSEGAAGVARDVVESDCIAKTGPTQHRITRTCLEGFLGNPTEMARGARVVPSIENGKSNGLKFYAIRPGSVFAQLGLQNGDTLRRVNGLDLTSPDKALEAYTSLRTATRIEMDLTRRGKPITLRYTIE